MTTLSTAKTAANKMISDTEGRIAKAMEREEWSEVVKFSSYLSGMQQMLVLFEMVKDEAQEVQRGE